MSGENAAVPITVLRNQAASGEADANEQLLNEIYPILRKLAHRQLIRSGIGKWQRPQRQTLDMRAVQDHGRNSTALEM